MAGKLSLGWIVGIVALFVLLVGGLLLALSSSLVNNQASQNVAALETQLRRTELAAGFVTTQTEESDQFAKTSTQAAAQAADRDATRAIEGANTEGTALHRLELACTPTKMFTLETSATPTSLPSSISDGKEVVMNLIPAGSFMMGSNADVGLAECLKTSSKCRRVIFEDEEPVHEVTLDAFYIDIYEVTNELYATCVSDGACIRSNNTISSTLSSYYDNSLFAQYPVIYVSWKDAVKFCMWRGARLPTEAEWEKAARGGLIGKKFPWGDEDPVCRKGAVNGAKFDGGDLCHGTSTEPVGSYAPNGYGLYDMAGNVGEWVQDSYRWDYYKFHSIWNNPIMAGGIGKVVRGSSWLGSRGDLRSARRFFRDKDSHYIDVGFRCVASVPKR